MIKKLELSDYINLPHKGHQDIRSLLVAIKNKQDEIIDHLNKQEPICGCIIQHTIAGEIKCGEKRPCKFHDVPQEPPDHHQRECLLP
jgi:hypothetical protein